jgi:hypothetical protein
MKTSRVILRITQAEIDRGKRNNCGLCPVALAATRALGQDMWFDTQLLMPMVGGEPIQVPEEIAAWAVAFDRGERMTPRDFPIDVPTKWLKG